MRNLVASSDCRTWNNKRPSGVHPLPYRRLSFCGQGYTRNANYHHHHQNDRSEFSSRASPTEGCLSAQATTQRMNMQNGQELDLRRCEKKMHGSGATHMDYGLIVHPNIFHHSDSTKNDSDCYCSWFPAIIFKVSSRRVDWSSGHQIRKRAR